MPNKILNRSRLNVRYILVVDVGLARD